MAIELPYIIIIILLFSGQRKITLSYGYSATQEHVAVIASLRGRCFASSDTEFNTPMNVHKSFI